MTSSTLSSADARTKNALTDHVLACSDPEVLHLDGDLTFSSGFMPRTAADRPLTGAHEAWEQLAGQLPALTTSPHAQRIIADLPMIPAGVDDLPDSQLKRAATVLGAIAQSYWRFGIGPMYLARGEQISPDLPAVVERPWRQVNHRLGRAEVTLSTEDCFFNNFTFIDADRIAADGTYRIEDARIELIRPKVPAFGNAAERVFISAFVEVNSVIAPVVPLACRLAEVLAEGGPDAHDEISTLLSGIADCARGAMKAFRRVSPRKGSATHCDPVELAKTFAMWDVPAPGYPTGPSGSATPVLHFFDALIGRSRYDTELGRFAHHLRDNQLPAKHRVFFDLVRELDVRGYVTGLADSAPARYREVSAAFNEVVSSFAGDDGFLGVHKGKVIDYLGVGTVVGRNQSTAHDQIFIADATWTGMADKLQQARDERTIRALDENQT
ncbi:hypothetical protein UK23_45180 [Lentzea aerocolonigenes]|uniref:Indoleamine 2,3-dioxygenase n=1 Tax=Lentzea aerocolonigenes TaxID=68170 RepID=A0A0F0GEF7_LENAE|nr:hypothetical protein [Lentzea aerocolonigenes]KJK33677.1 hypothetical protein UK23_45180 [Lentzea aerocolonigenes]